MDYRAEIDGLRAVAVLPVIMFHAGVTAFSGGFVGVDVFFVISGYLITTIIAGEIEDGRFSIQRFYERRARRILPALFLVMLVCIPFAWAWMLPEQLKNFAQSIVAVNLFASNVLFWKESGYFEPAADDKPLLHTWSLAVEEQYYVFFPLALLLLWRFGRNPTFALIVVGAAVSFALSEWLWQKDPQAAFYLIPTRAWELFAGSICALLLHHRRPVHNNWLAGAGLLLIVGSFVAYDAATPFPGTFALAPVLGTTLIILFAARETIVGRLLSTRVLVVIGLMSYSAYLWHQPLFAFARLRTIYAPTLWLMLALAAASLGLAYLSWRFVEQPFRRSKPGRWRQAAFVGGALAASSAFVGFGLFGHLTDGFGRRIDPLVVTYLEAADDTNPYFSRCMHSVDRGEPFPALPVEDCVFPATIKAQAGRTLILGDSHANAIAFPLMERLRASGYEVTQLTTIGCAPFPGFSFAGRDCTRANAAIYEFLEDNSYDITISAFRLQTLAFDTPFDNTVGGREAGAYMQVFFDAEYLGLPDEASRLEKALVVLGKGIDRLSSLSHHLILLGPIPEAGWNVPEQLAKLAMFDHDVEHHTLHTPYKRFVERNAPVLDLLAGIHDPKVHMLWPHRVLCGTSLADACLNAFAGQVFYYDNNHLSNTGGELLARLVVEKVESFRNGHAFAPESGRVPDTVGPGFEAGLIQSAQVQDRAETGQAVFSFSPSKK